SSEERSAQETVSDNVIPFRLGIVEVRLPFALRPPRRQVRVHCLGKFEIELDGRAIGPWRNQRARLVLAFLLTRRPEQVSRHLLAGTFWPEHSDERAQNNLSLAVMSARRMLTGQPGEVAESLIRATAGGYGIDGEADVWLDSEAFVKAAADGTRLEAGGSP